MQRFWKVLWDFEYALAAVGAGLALLVMMLMTVISVFGRYVLHIDLIPGTFNIVERVLFPLLVMWGLPAAHREGLFPRLDLMRARISPRARAALAVFVGAVEIAIYTIVLYYVYLFVSHGITTNRQMQIGTAFWPLWPVIVMMLLAFGLMLVEMLRLVWRDVRRTLGYPDPPENET